MSHNPDYPVPVKHRSKIIEARSENGELVLLDEHNPDAWLMSDVEVCLRN